MSTYTEKVVISLDEYLTRKDYYSSPDNDQSINSNVLELWRQQFINAITKDINETFPDVNIVLTTSEFDIVSEDDRGACVFYQRATITDPVYSENLQISIKTIVNYHIVTAYLRSEYATIEKWPGRSRTLNYLFSRLNEANNVPGYFSPVSWQHLLTK